MLIMWIGVSFALAGPAREGVFVPKAIAFLLIPLPYGPFFGTAELPDIAQQSLPWTLYLVIWALCCPPLSDITPVLAATVSGLGLGLPGLLPAYLPMFF